MSKGELRRHQIKSSFTGEKFWNVSFYCGGNMVVPLASVEKTKEAIESGEHCKRCLRALQLKKGEDYMHAIGLPLQDIKKY